MHAVFMGEESLPSDGVWVTRSDNKISWGAHWHTSHYDGMIDTANVACISDIWHACSTSAPSEATSLRQN